MQVVKRDGSLQEFDGNKIVEAISKAFNACCPEENKEVITSMVTDMHLWDGITIEEIQDVVIETLRDYGYDDVASTYSQYRSEQSRLREIIAKISYQDNYINSSENAATSSETDGNANVVSKNVATLAISSTLPPRRRGIFCIHSLRISSDKASVIAVSMNPGAMALARIPREPIS